MVDQAHGHSDFPQLIDLVHGLPDGASSIQPGYEIKQYDTGADYDKDNEDCSLFVGDIPKTMTEEQMKDLFSPFGEVVNVDIKRDRITKASLGYAFIQLKTRGEASNAKKNLHKTVVGNRAIRIGWAQKNTNLFVGDLDPSVTNEMLRERFKEFGEIVDDETFAKKQNYGFVKFRRRADAEVAKREMDGKVLGGRRIRTGWGDTNTQRHCVHIQFDSVPSSSSSAMISEEDLFKSFSPFGTVLNVHLPRNGSRLRGFGFVRYSDNDEGEESAEAAIAALHNTRIAGVLITCNFGKKQHPRKPTAVIPPINPHHISDEYSHYVSANPNSPKESSKLQMAHENTFPINNSNGNDNDSHYDTLKSNDTKTETTQLHTGNHSTKPKGKIRSSYHKHNTFSSPQNTRNHKMPLSSHASQMPPSQMDTLPPSHSHSLPMHSHSQYSMNPQMIPTMYPTTSWVPTQDGWVPYVVPQFYPPTAVSLHEDNNNSVNNLGHFHGGMSDDVPVYMYSYPNHGMPFHQSYSYAYSSHAT